MTQAPDDADTRRAIPPVICYPNDTLPKPDLPAYRAAFSQFQKTGEVLVPPRDARCFRVPAGGAFRITSVEAPQVGDLNLWNAHDLPERFFSGKTRALHGTHVTTGDRLWSSLPYLRPMATIIEDTLSWYGLDSFGGGVHDVIGTRCDPYTGRLLSGDDYHYCCHSNLTRALASELNLPLWRSGRGPCARCPERLHVHRFHARYRTILHEGLAGPSRRPHYLSGRDPDLLGALSACPGGDCSSTHSSDDGKRCAPLLVEVFEGTAARRVGSAPGCSPYPRTHGLG